MALTAGSVRAIKAGAAPRLLHVTDMFPQPRNADSPEMRAACERGTLVHELCELHDKDQPHPEIPGLAGYLVAWIRFRVETGAEILENELRIGGAKFGYVGRLDRVAQIKNRVWILDIKSGGPWPTHGPQTAAYEHAYRTEHWPRRTKEFRRGCVHLKKDGTYKIVEHQSVHDWHTFCAYQRIAYFEIEHGLREWPAERED